MNVIGTRVKELRLTKGLSREELAKRAGYQSASMIKSIEEGTKKPAFDKNLDLAKALGVSVNELLGKKKSLTKKEQIVLGGVAEYLEHLSEEDIKLGLKVFRLIYDAHIGAEAKRELEKIKDRKTLLLHKEKYGPVGNIESLDPDVEEMAEVNMESVLRSIPIEAVRGKRAAIIEMSSSGGMCCATVSVGGQIVSCLRKRGVSTTNNVELLTEALESSPEINGCDVISVYTDSDYLRKGINYWVLSWKENGWKKSNGKPISHLSFWKKIYSLRKEKELRAYARH